MTDSAAMTLERYREVVAITLSGVHSCPREIITEMMDYYADVIRGSWSAGAVAADVIKLLYAEWKTFRK